MLFTLLKACSGRRLTPTGEKLSKNRSEACDQVPNLRLGMAMGTTVTKLVFRRSSS